MALLLTLLGKPRSCPTTAPLVKWQFFYPVSSVQAPPCGQMVRAPGAGSRVPHPPCCAKSAVSVVQPPPPPTPFPRPPRRAARDGWSFAKGEGMMHMWSDYSHVLCTWHAQHSVFRFASLGVQLQSLLEPFARAQWHCFPKLYPHTGSAEKSRPLISCSCSRKVFSIRHGLRKVDCFSWKWVVLGATGAQHAITPPSTL